MRNKSATEGQAPDVLRDHSPDAWPSVAYQ